MRREGQANRVLIRFHGGTFAVFRALHFGARLTQNRDAQIPDLLVQGGEGRFGKFVRRSEVLLEARDVRQRAVEVRLGGVFRR